ncbi:DivIVA domain-containing protein [Lapillicoccus sp.]|uniref:DivIVA domain-containing protein n=1 Tax=Lapillicoccus sp. TaxID=1909287 RepID=UPI00326791D8
MTRDELAELIDNTRFQTSALSRGYDEQGVDDALGAVANAIRTGDSREQLTSLVGSLRFQPTTLRRGYEQEAVDRLLEHVITEVAALDLRDGVAAPVTPTASDAGSRPAVDTRRPTLQEEEQPSAVDENPTQGLFGRLFRRA